jgi:phosphoesterase RecJ-like protein
LLSEKDKKVAIVSHSNPDGDALGSALAMLGFLKNDGFTNVSVVVPNNFPDFLSWMPWSDEVIIGTKKSKEAARVIMEANVVFCLDFNSLDRAENLQGPLKKSTALKVLIDHHPQPSDDFDLYYSNVNASSTAELVYEFFCLMEKEELVSVEVAKCLYAGIITDTGSLSYSCNNPRTYHIVGKLVEIGADAENIQRLIYNTFSENRLRLLGFSLNQKLVVMHKYHTAYISLSKGDLKDFDFQIGDTEGIVNHGLSIKGVDMAAIFLQYNDYVKISFRSSGPVDVNEFARQYFNGGGHRNASGGKSNHSLEETIEMFEKMVVQARQHI